VKERRTRESSPKYSPGWRKRTSTLWPSADEGDITCAVPSVMKKTPEESSRMRTITSPASKEMGCTFSAMVWMSLAEKPMLERESCDMTLEWYSLTFDCTCPVSSSRCTAGATRRHVKSNQAKSSHERTLNVRRQVKSKSSQVQP
jgi:hypothetical protein